MSATSARVHESERTAKCRPFRTLSAAVAIISTPAVWGVILQFPFYAGIAGGLYAFYFQYISPEQYEVLQSAAILTMVVLGGMSTTWGPVVGAILLISVPQVITFLNLPPSVMAPIQGIIFTTLVLLFLFLRPAGIVGNLGKPKQSGGE